MTAGLAAGRETEAQPLDDLAREAMARWQVPGLAIAIVRDGRPFLQRTFGVRNVENAVPVTNATLFAIGSITKSMNALAISQMVEEGAFEWDTPLSRILPAFRQTPLRDARHITLEDALSHRSGLPRHDALWYLHAFNRPELIRRVSRLRRTLKPGRKYGYSNLMPALAGEAAARTATSTWAKLIATRVFRPNEMTQSVVGRDAFLASVNRATGYFPANDGRIAIPLRDTDPIAPAAAVYASISDMARYLLHLATELPPAMAEPRIEVRGPGRDPAIGAKAYALGLEVTSYRNTKTLRHPGVIDGFGALITLVPEKRAGVIVLSNLSGYNPVPAILTRAVLDDMLGHDRINWAARFPARRDFGKQEFTDAGPLPGGWRVLKGRYSHPAYGTIRLIANDTGLEGRLHDLAFALIPDRNGDWRLKETVWPLRAGLRFAFQRDSNGRVISLTAPIADGPTYRINAGPLRFVRQ